MATELDFEFRDLDTLSVLHEQKIMLIAMPYEVLEQYIQDLEMRMSNKAREIADCSLMPNGKGLSNQMLDWYKAMKGFYLLATKEREKRSK